MRQPANQRRLLGCDQSACDGPPMSVITGSYFATLWSNFDAMQHVNQIFPERIFMSVAESEKPAR